LLEGEQEAANQESRPKTPPSGSRKPKLGTGMSK
jgi:hypothetical protein